MYLSVRIPPSKYSYFSLNVIAGKKDGSCPVIWDEQNAKTYAPLWEAKAQLEIILLQAAEELKPDAYFRAITNQTAGKEWKDNNRPSTASVGLNISQLVIWDEADVITRLEESENDVGFEIEKEILESMGPNY